MLLERVAILWNIFIICDMNDAKLDYLIQLMEADIQINATNKALLMQNNVLLKSILAKLTDPANDMRDLFIDTAGNILVYEAAKMKDNK